MTKDTAKRPCYCHNCHYPLPSYGKYCTNCGQKYTTGKIPVLELLRDFVESVLNIDSKIFRTLGAIWKPGKLTIQYFKGYHKRYVPPLRLFFVLAIIHFAVLGYVALEDFETEVQESNESQLRAAYLADFRNELDSARQTVERQFNRQAVVATALDSLEQQLKDTRKDSGSLAYFKYHHETGLDLVTKEISIRDMMEMPLDSLAATYGDGTFGSSIQLRQMAKLRRQGGSFTRFALGQLIWMVVLMMQALALLLRLLYIRRKHYYVEHLVFSFHYHAFSFLVVTLALLCMEFELSRFSFFFSEEVLFPIAFGVILWYLFVAMRRFYRQHWMKTFIKYCIINFSYVFIFSLFLFLTLVATTLLF